MRLALAAALLVVTAPGALGAELHPTLVITLHVKPADRPALRRQLETRQVARLAAWRKQGVLVSYHLLFTRHADSASWDAMELLGFADAAMQARWNAIERNSPAGLDGSALKLVKSIESTPGDALRTKAGPTPGNHPAYLVVPYQPLVSASEYMTYIDGYTLPQFDGWIHENVLDGYELHYARYPAARAWQSLILLRYRDDAALEAREATTAKVRAQLAVNPTWKAFSDNKKGIRTEGVVALADELAEGGL